VSRQHCPALCTSRRPCRTTFTEPGAGWCSWIATALSFRLGRMNVRLQDSSPALTVAKQSWRHLAPGWDYFKITPRGGAALGSCTQSSPVRISAACWARMSFFEHSPNRFISRRFFVQILNQMQRIRRIHHCGAARPAMMVSQKDHKQCFGTNREVPEAELHNWLASLLKNRPQTWLMSRDVAGR